MQIRHISFTRRLPLIWLFFLLCVACGNGEREPVVTANQGDTTSIEVEAELATPLSPHVSDSASTPEAETAKSLTNSTIQHNTELSKYITFSLPAEPDRPRETYRTYDPERERDRRFERPYRTSDVIVQFKSTINESERDAIVKERGGLRRVAQPSFPLPFDRVLLPIGHDIKAAIASFAADPRVLFVEANHLVFLQGEIDPATFPLGEDAFDSEFPDDPYFGYQWALKKIGVEKVWQYADVEETVRVAVLDTGIDNTHPDLFPHLLPGSNVLDENDEIADQHGHGTLVAGIIGASINNSEGIAGISPDIEILPIKIMEGHTEGSTADLAAGIYYAIGQGADIITISVGTYADSVVLHNAIVAAQNAGVLVVAAAGNDATTQPMFPAAYPSVLSVTATDQYDQLWSKNNTGPTIDLAAPGVSIFSTMTGGGYTFSDGTSMAVPHVAGAAALLMSIDPTQSSNDIASALTFAATDLGKPGQDDQYGFGRLDITAAYRKGNAPIHDVAVTALEIDQFKFQPGESTLVSVEIENQGNVDEKGLTLTLSINGEDRFVDTISYLGAGDSRNIWFEWIPKVKRDIMYHDQVIITAAIAPVDEEFDGEDNQLTKQFVATPGDTDSTLTLQYGVAVHQNIVSKALDYLKQKKDKNLINPDMYDELKEHESILRKGALSEDKSIVASPFHSKLLTNVFEYIPLYDDAVYEDVNCRWFHHFLRPIDQKGYYVPDYFATPCLANPGFYPNSYVWGGKENATNHYDWEDGLESYYETDPVATSLNYHTKMAYYTLGHVLHLLADSSVPEHTHLEAHAEESFPLPGINDDELLNIKGGYEKYMSLQGESGLTSRMDAAYLLEIIDDYSVEDFFQEMATFSYNQNLFQGNLGTGPVGSGELKLMFPSLHLENGINITGADDDWKIEGDDATSVFALNWGGENDSEYAIEPSDDFWKETEFIKSHIPGANHPDLDGYYYIEKSNKVCPKYFNGSSSYKGENLADNKADGDTCTIGSLASLMADAIVPKIVQFTGSMMKKFWDMTHAYLFVENNSVNFLKTATYGGGNLADYKISFTVLNHGQGYAKSAVVGFRPVGSTNLFALQQLQQIQPTKGESVTLTLSGIELEEGPVVKKVGDIEIIYFHHSKKMAEPFTYPLYVGNIKDISKPATPDEPGGVDFSAIDLKGLKIDPENGLVDFVVKGTVAQEGEKTVDVAEKQKLFQKTFLTALTIPNWKQFISLDLLPDGNGGYKGKARTEHPFQNTDLAVTMWVADVAMKFDLFNPSHMVEFQNYWVQLVSQSGYSVPSNFWSWPDWVARGTIVPGDLGFTTTSEKAFVEKALLDVATGWIMKPKLNLGNYNLSEATQNYLQTTALAQYTQNFETKINEQAEKVAMLINSNEADYGKLIEIYPAVVLAHWYKSLPQNNLPLANLVNSEDLEGIASETPFDQNYWDGQANQFIGGANGTDFSGQSIIWNYWGGTQFNVKLGDSSGEVTGENSSILEDVGDGDIIEDGGDVYFSGGSAGAKSPDLSGSIEPSTSPFLATELSALTVSIVNASSQSATNFSFTLQDKFVTAAGKTQILPIAGGVIDLLPGWQSIEKSLTWNVPDLIGNHQLLLTIDSKNQIQEAVESNNIFEMPIAVNSPKPTMIITEPSHNQIVGEHDVSLKGVGIDAYGTPLDASTMVWASSVDGPLGSGGNLVADLSPGQHLISLTGTDAKGHTSKKEISLIVAKAGEPVVSILSPLNGSVHSSDVPLQCVGQATDVKDGVLSGPQLEWSSSLDGPMGTGTTFSTNTLSIGLHTLSLKATTTDGSVITTSVQITIQKGKPEIAIISPLTGKSLFENEGLTFTAQAFDPQDGDLSNNVTWHSSVDGVLGKGNNFIHSLSPGNHTITASVTDKNGLTANQSVTLTINPAPPTVVILSPPPNSEIPYKSPLSLNAIATDWEENPIADETITWSSSINGFLGSGASLTTSALSFGEHLLTVMATAPNGGTAANSVTVVIDAGQPKLTITSPPSGTSFFYAKPIQLTGTVSDEQDANLTGTWESSSDGVIGTGNTMTSSTLSPGTHTITFSAIDSNGWKGNSSTQIIVEPPHAPEIFIVLPKMGSIHLNGEPVSFKASAVDFEDGALEEEKMTWISSLDGQLGSGSNLSLNTLSIGQHHITLSVTDNSETSSSLTVDIEIISRSPVIEIDYPTKNEYIFPQNSEIKFIATGTDYEDGDLPDFVYIWTSHVDGLIGVGSNISTSSLSVGTHEVKLSVTDSDNQVSEKSIVVIIQAKNSVLLSTFSDGSETYEKLFGDLGGEVSTSISLPKDAEVINAQMVIEGDKGADVFQKEPVNVIIPMYPNGNPMAPLDPTLADIDNDGDLDLFIGHFLGILFYRNDGNAINPIWTFVTDKFIDLSTIPSNGLSGYFSCSPGFVDIDNDGDFDLFVGVETFDWAIDPKVDGHLIYYKNNGSPENPKFTFVTSEYINIQSSHRTTSAFSDIDNDGDFDLFVGDSDGSLRFYRNDGSATDPQWTFVKNMVTQNNGVNPEFVDIDSDGDHDLFLGHWGGNISYHENIGTPNESQFVEITNFYMSIYDGCRAAPAFMDIDSDGDWDMFNGRVACNNPADDGVLYLHRNVASNLHNPYLDVGDDNSKEWSVEGEFKGSITTDNFADSLNQFLATSTQGTGGTVDIPIVFGSTSGGAMNLSYLNVQYKITDTELPEVLSGAFNKPIVKPSEGGLSLSILAHDNQGVDSVVLDYLGTLVPLVKTSTVENNEIFTASNMTAPPKSGSYVFNVTATDKSGLQSVLQVSLAVQPNGPEVSIDAQDVVLSHSSPDEHTMMSATVTVHNYGDVGVETLVNATLLLQCPGGGICSVEEEITLGNYPVVLPASGTHTVVVNWEADLSYPLLALTVDPLNTIADDKDNNSVTFPFSVQDATPPTLSSISLPDTWENTAGTLTVSASDNGGVPSVKATIGTTTFPLMLSSEKFTATIPPYAAGDYTVAVQATDTAGIAATKSIQWKVKKALPDFVIGPMDLTFSKQNPLVDETINIMTNVANAGSTSATSTLTISIDGVGSAAYPITLEGGDAITITHPWNAVYGNHTISAAIDAAGIVAEISEENNGATQALTVVNSTPPQIGDVTLPGFVVQNTPTLISVPIASQIPLDSAVVILNQLTIPLTCTNGTCTGEIVFTSYGAIPLILQATDISALTQTKQISVTVISDLPDLSITKVVPTPIFPHDGEPQTLAITIANTGFGLAQNVNVVLTVDGESLNSEMITVVEQEAILTLDWTTIFGEHTLQISVDPEDTVAEVENTNNTFLYHVTVEDATPPVIHSVTFPSSIVVGSAFTVSTDVEDNVEMASVTAATESDNAVLVYNPESKHYEASLTAGFAETEMLTVTATDTHQLTTTYQQSITFDSVDPDLQISSFTLTPALISEEGESTINLVIKNSGLFSTENVTVDFLVDALPLSSWNGDLMSGEEKNIAFNWLPIFGEHVMTLAVDPQNNIQEIDENNNNLIYTLYVADITPPTTPIPIAIPAAWSEVPEYTITWSPSTDAHGIIAYRLKLDNGVWMDTDLDTNATLIVSTEGMHQLSVAAVDSNDNVSEAGTVTLYYDSTSPDAPVIKEVDCGTQWTQHASPRITWPIPADLGSGVEGYIVARNGIELDIGNVAEYHPTVESGAHTFTLKAYDALNHTSAWSNSVTVKIDATPPAPPTITSPTHVDSDQPEESNKPIFLLETPPDDSGIAGYHYILDQEPTTEPDNYSYWMSADTSGTTELNIPGIASINGTVLPIPNGQWYLHAKSLDKVGLTSMASSHYKITIAAPPSLSRYDADGDGFGDLTILTKSLGLFVKTYGVTSSDGPIMFNSESLPHHPLNQIDMGRLAGGWPSALIEWNQESGKLLYYQSTGATFDAGNTALSANDFPFTFDSAAGDLLLVGDIDGNDRDDLIFYHAQDKKLYYSLVANFKAFPPTEWKILPTDGNPLAGDHIHIADLDGDKRADVVVTRNRDATLWFSLNQSGNWESDNGLVMNFVQGDVARFADFTGDGLADGVWISAGQRAMLPRLMVKRNISSGGSITFSEAETWGKLSLPLTLHEGDQMYVDYFTPDTMADIVIYSKGIGVTRFSSTGSTFEPIFMKALDWTFIPDISGDDVINTTLYDLRGESLIDTDEDGIIDLFDNCPAEPNHDQLDDDKDGVGNKCAGYPLCIPGCFSYGSRSGDINNDADVDITDIQCMILASLAELEKKPYPGCMAFTPEMVDWDCSGALNVVDTQFSILAKFGCTVDGCAYDGLAKVDNDGDGIHDQCDDCQGFVNQCVNQP